VESFQVPLLKFFEVKVVAADAKVFDDVRNDATRHVARMPGESDEAIGAKRIGIMPMTAHGAEVFAADFTQATVELAAISGRIFAHESSGEDELVTKCGGNWASGFEQRFQVRLGGLLKTESGFAAITSMRVTARQHRRLGDPHAILILAKLDF
jgi:hypothetical protein